MDNRLKALREIPQVDKLIQDPLLSPWPLKLAHGVRVRLAQELTNEIRAAVEKGEACPTAPEVAKRLEGRFEDLVGPRIQRAINATGIILHTNLGRAPLGAEILGKLARELVGYCTLEMDSQTGARGSRTKQVERFLTLLSGAESALVVNNNAAALFLIMQGLARDKKAVISRGELVQIGGGFRIHEILESSGASLSEVGTTNITTLEDYAKAISNDVAMILKVHQSNFSIQGHTKAPSLEAIGQVARKADIPFVVDLGSGGWEDSPDGDPSIAQVLASGCDLVCFSGDKLLGGSQAGIILGRRSFVERLRENPLYRALRLGKLDLYLLEETLQLHIAGKKTLTDSLIEMSLDTLSARAEQLAGALKSQGIDSVLVSGETTIGGGTTPERALGSVLVEITVKDEENAAKRLLKHSPPIVVRKSKGKLAIDLRTVLPDEESELRAGIQCLF